MLLDEGVISVLNRRMRQVLVHSFIYYQLNDSIIEDYTFDRWSKDIVMMRRQYPEEFAQTFYADAFKDFDGSSGYDLPYSNPEIQAVGYRMINRYRELKNKQMIDLMHRHGIQ